MPSTLGLDNLPSIPVEGMDDRVCEISFFVLLTIVNIIEALQNWGLKSLCFEMIIEPCALLSLLREQEHFILKGAR